jgi:hypothetical protein
MEPTVSELRQILTTSVNDTDLQAFIDSADLFIQQNLGTSDLGVEILEQITKWFAAHMVFSSRERLSIKEEAGTAKIEYAGSYGAGLQSTPYGQMVLTLDTTGFMASLAGKKIKFKSL